MFLSKQTKEREPASFSKLIFLVKKLHNLTSWPSEGRELMNIHLLCRHKFWFCGLFRSCSFHISVWGVLVYVFRKTEGGRKEDEHPGKMLLRNGDRGEIVCRGPGGREGKGKTRAEICRGRSVVTLRIGPGSHASSSSKERHSLRLIQTGRLLRRSVAGTTHNNQPAHNCVLLLL